MIAWMVTLNLNDLVGLGAGHVVQYGFFGDVRDVSTVQYYGTIFSFKFGTVRKFLFLFFIYLFIFYYYYYLIVPFSYPVE